MQTVVLKPFRTFNWSYLSSITAFSKYLPLISSIMFYLKTYLIKLFMICLTIFCPVSVLGMALN